MKDCYYCGRRQVGNNPLTHHEHCPEHMPLMKAVWREGYYDGKAGKPQRSKDPTYTMGYGSGVCTLETMENEHNPYW